MTFYALWVGENLPNFQKLCLSSFIENSFEVNLFTYNEVTNLPKGIKILDANDIVPKNKIFIKETFLGKSLAAFSDFFRYEMFNKIPDSIWIDCDIFCLSSDWKGYLDQENIFVSQGIGDLVGSILKIKNNSDILQEFISESNRLKDSDMSKTWGDIGPDLITRIVMDNNLESFIINYENIYSPEYDIDSITKKENLEKSLKIIQSEGVFAIVFWNSSLRSKGICLEPNCPNLKDSLIDYLFRNSQEFYTKETTCSHN